jgi:hypothetical protein
VEHHRGAVAEGAVRLGDRSLEVPTATMLSNDLDIDAVDPEVAALAREEYERRAGTICLIPAPRTGTARLMGAAATPRAPWLTGGRAGGRE